MEETNTNVEATETTTQTETQVATLEVKEPSYKELAKELSKELGVNLFDKDGLNTESLKMMKELIDSQKTKEQLDAEVRQAKEDELQALLKEKSQWEFEKAAMNLNIDLDKQDDIKVLLNAKRAPEQPMAEALEQLVSEYPIFQKAADTANVDTTKKITRLGMPLDGNSLENKPSDLQRFHDSQYKDSPYYKAR